MRRVAQRLLHWVEQNHTSLLSDVEVVKSSLSSSWDVGCPSWSAAMLVLQHLLNGDARPNV